MKEKRGMERYSLAVPAKVSVIDNDRCLEEFEAYTKDVSSKGTFIAMEKPLEVGQRVQLKLYLSINKLREFFELDNTVRIEVSGEVVRNEKTGVGICFDKRYTILPSNKDE